MMILQLKHHPNGIADEPHTIFDPKGSGQASHGMRNKTFDDLETGLDDLDDF